MNIKSKIIHALGFMAIFWFFGGGFFISLLCLIWTWKLALAVFCFWACFCLVSIIYSITSVSTSENKKKHII